MSAESSSLCIVAVFDSWTGTVELVGEVGLEEEHCKDEMGGVILVSDMFAVFSGVLGGEWLIWCG